MHGPDAAVLRWIVVEDPASPFAFDIEIHVLGVPAGWCPADLDLDGQLNFFDIARFLQAFAEHSPWANLNEDTLVDFDDVQMFLGLFTAGCP
ncbi:MAG: GC-type dockerin domain-anchored protein [Planctomycetota bacterium]